MYIRQEDLTLAGGAVVAAVVVYIFLWKKNRPLAVVLLVGLAGYLLYVSADWQYWSKYFFVDWGGSGLTN